MFSTLRTRFGIPGVISVIALVFALFGGAYAANNSSNAGKATASAKAKKGPRGPKGATGPAGPAGAQGPAGPAGAKGDAGAAGAAGAAGEKGATGAAGAKGATGAAGATGATGPTGFSGFTETLPSGKTETGTWTAGTFGTEKIAQPAASISYPIPLATPSEHVVVLDKAETDASTETPKEGCEYEPSDPAAEPVAPLGTLCVFTRYQGVEGEESEISFLGLTFNGNNDSPAGTYVWAKPGPSFTELGIGKFELWGVWAVTAK